MDDNLEAIKILSLSHFFPTDADPRMSDSEYLAKREKLDQAYKDANPSWEQQLAGLHKMATTLTSDVGLRSLVCLPLPVLNRLHGLIVLAEKQAALAPLTEPDLPLDSTNASSSSAAARSPPRNSRRGRQTRLAVPTAEEALDHVPASPRPRDSRLRAHPKSNSLFSPE